MRFLNLFYSDTYGIQVLFGSLGDCIADNGDGSFSVLPPADSSMDPGTWKWTNAHADSGCLYISDDVQLNLPTDMPVSYTHLDVYKRQPQGAYLTQSVPIIYNIAIGANSFGYIASWSKG